MLKGKRSISACSLSSCRLRAEALARAFNNRIWPCVWISQKSSVERDDGMSNGIDNEEEFFDASPSPVELGDESLFCQQHSSAATEAGRAKLYELLQQHANDDATDVFYDVGEEATLNDIACDTCLNVDAKEVGYESSENSSFVKDETYLSNNLDKDEIHSEFTLHGSNQSNNNPVTLENFDNNDLNINDMKYQQTSLNLSDTCSSNFENGPNGNVSEEKTINCQSSENLPNEDGKIISEKEILNGTQTENTTLSKSNNLPFSNGTSTENGGYHQEIENEEIVDLPSSDDSSVVPNVEHESFLKKEKHPRVLAKALFEEDINNDVENEQETPAEVTIEVGSPSTSSDSSEAKPVSPVLGRLQVFEDPRPKILRSISLKTGKTPPGTPSRKKIVRFADVLGLDLEDVRHIMSGDIPTIPSSAYTDLNLKDIDIPSCEPIPEKVEIHRRDSSNWQTVQRSTATNAFYLLFSPPGEQPGFLERVRQQGVCLETATISEVNVQCTCKVMNYGYHKKVVARYTVNDWLSYNDIDASYVLGSSNGDTDSFAFSIFLSPLNKGLKLALKYEVNGKEYWDNNRNQNYCFGYHGKDPMNLPSPPLPSFQHEFW